MPGGAKFVAIYVFVCKAGAKFGQIYILFFNMLGRIYHEMCYNSENKKIWMF